MIIKTLFFVIAMIFCSFPFLVNAATYNYYFSNGAIGNAQGNDLNDCSIGTPCQTLSKVTSKINALSSSDTVNLYFDRGDTWTWDSDKVSLQSSAVVVRATNPIVHIDAYGSGDRPVFDGTVTDFSTVPEHNVTTGPFKWNRFFEIARENCSISNIEIKNVYGHGVFLNDNIGSSDGFVLSSTVINNFGSCAITSHAEYGTERVEIGNNVIHTGQQLVRFNKVGGIGWSGSVTLASKTRGTLSMCKENHIHHNIIYDIFGEGIIAPNSIVEYNVIGDTSSFGIGSDPRDFNVTEGVVRYNLVVFSDWDKSVYTGAAASGTSAGNPTGIRYFDDFPGGDNSSGNVQIYGNIIINRAVGIWFYSPEDPNNPLNSIKIYNNTVIDSKDDNYRFYHANEANNGYFYNNSSIIYDRPNAKHVQHDASFPDSDWTIGDNHFWTNGGSPVVVSVWQKNYDISDPKLMGEPLVNWIKQIGSTYYLNINPATHLNPPSDSLIFGLSPILSMDIGDIVKSTSDLIISSVADPIKAPADFQTDIN